MIQILEHRDLVLRSDEHTLYDEWDEDSLNWNGMVEPYNEQPLEDDENGESGLVAGKSGPDERISSDSTVLY